MTWVLLALGSAVSLSLTDLFAKRALASLPVPAVAWVRFAFPLPVLAGLVIAVAPVTLHNWRAERAFIPVAANGGINFYLGNRPGALRRCCTPWRR